MDVTPRRQRIWPINTIVGALALSSFVRLPGLLNGRPLDDDETYLASMGKMLRAGDVLYRDVIDRKPPLVMWAYQLLVPHSWDLRPIRLVVSLLIALNGLVLYSIAKRLGLSDRSARTAAALTIIGSALAGFSDAQAANFEVWGLAAASAGVLFAFVASSATTTRNQFGALFASGALVGVATNCKQPYIFTLIVVAFVLLRSIGILRTLLPVLSFATVTCAIAFLSGWGRYWKWVWFENGDYINIGFMTVVTLAIRQCVVFVLTQWPLSTAILPSLRRKTLRLHQLIAPERRATQQLGLIWFGTALVGVASGLRFFGHYFQQCVPALGLLAAAALDGYPERARRRIALATGFVPLLWTLSWVPGFAGLDASPRDLPRGIAARTTTQDRVLVWGRLPDAAVQAHRIPTGQFVHQAYLTGSWASIDGVDDPGHTEPYAQRWNDYLTGLVRSPPAIIVDASPIVDGWQRYSIERLPLQRLINACYRRIDDIDNLHAYERLARHAVARSALADS